MYYTTHIYTVLQGGGTRHMYMHCMYIHCAPRRRCAPCVYVLCSEMPDVPSVRAVRAVRAVPTMHTVLTVLTPDFCRSEEEVRRWRWRWQMADADVDVDADEMQMWMWM